MYFEVQTAGVYERLRNMTVIIRATRHDDSACADGCSTINVCLFKYLSTWDLYYAYCAYGCGTRVAGAIYANVLQERQQHYIYPVMRKMTCLIRMLPLPSLVRYKVMKYQGKEWDEARYTWLLYLPKEAYFRCRHALCTQRDGGMDNLWWVNLYDICARCSLILKRKIANLASFLIMIC